jgi:hypothetical protein
MSNNTVVKPPLHDNDLILKRIERRIEGCPRLAKSHYCDECPVFMACRRLYDAIVLKSVNQNGLKKEDYQEIVDRVTKIQAMVK